MQHGANANPGFSEHSPSAREATVHSRDTIFADPVLRRRAFLVVRRPAAPRSLRARSRTGPDPGRPPKQRQDRIEYLFLEISFIEKYQNVKNFARTYKALVNYTPQLMVSDLSLQD